MSELRRPEEPRTNRFESQEMVEVSEGADCQSRLPANSGLSDIWPEREYVKGDRGYVHHTAVFLWGRGTVFSS